MQMDFDEQFFPSKDYRLRFLRVYLKEFHKAEGVELDEEEFVAELNDLFCRVNLAAAGHILKWCIFLHFFEFNQDVSGTFSNQSGANFHFDFNSNKS